MRNEFVVISLLVVAAVVLAAIFWSPVYWWWMALVGPLVLLGYYDMFQAKHAIMRNFPILGRGRYVMEELRPKLYQYFIESDTNGRPLSRIFRAVVYQRAKGQNDTAPFGT
ncbi:MAG: FMN-binding glutamate synthase family protein, partial [Bacteroidetes bacterium]